MSEMIQASKMDAFFKSSEEIKRELIAAQAEIARLREALWDIHEAYNNVTNPIEFLNVGKALHKHADLITKINKEE